jgi:Sec-independent protein translocase protein TatA
MDFLGIGPLELLLIFVIILLVLGPSDMVKAGNSIGEFIRKIMKSDSWQAVRKASKEMRTLPNRLAREAGIQEFEKEMREATKGIPTKKDLDIGKIDPGIAAWTKPPSEKQKSEEKEESISPEKESDTPPQES